MLFNVLRIKWNHRIPNLINPSLQTLTPPIPYTLTLPYPYALKPSNTQAPNPLIPNLRESQSLSGILRH